MICWFRIILIPFVLLFMLTNPVTADMSMQTRFLIGGIIFGVAMISDAVDGKIARDILIKKAKNNLIYFILIFTPYLIYIHIFYLLNF